MHRDKEQAAIYGPSGTEGWIACNQIMDLIRAGKPVKFVSLGVLFQIVENINPQNKGFVKAIRWSWESYIREEGYVADLMQLCYRKE